MVVTSLAVFRGYNSNRNCRTNNHNGDKRGVSTAGSEGRPKREEQETNEREESDTPPRGGDQYIRREREGGSHSRADHRGVLIKSSSSQTTSEILPHIYFLIKSVD